MPGERNNIFQTKCDFYDFWHCELGKSMVYF